LREGEKVRYRLCERSPETVDIPQEAERQPNIKNPSKAVYFGGIFVWIRQIIEKPQKLPKIN